MIEGLRQGPEIFQSLRSPNLQNSIFQAIGKSLVESITERGRTPLDLSCQTIKLGDVLGDVMTLLHLEVLEVMLHGSGRIERSKICSEFVLELHIVQEEKWWISKIAFQEEGFEPLKCSSPEIGNRICDFRLVRCKSPMSIF